MPHTSSSFVLVKAKSILIHVFNMYKCAKHTNVKQIAYQITSSYK
jgi:hypothetical protein